MDKEDFKNMANNPDFIPGIYNYCDRWCERCPYTSRCFLFATERKQFPDGEPHDITNEEFWEQIGEMFKLAFELLEDAAEEQGIDLDEINTETLEQNDAENRSRTQNHPAAVRARQYISKVHEWFEQSEPAFSEKGEELAQLAKLELSEENISKKLASLQDYVEIIRWYQHQIYAKIMRALQSKMDDYSLAEDPIQNDQNGSAKVALIGIERSIAAWGGLLKIFPEKEDEILALLVILEQIRNQTKRAFPDARKFQRPGFDE